MTISLDPRTSKTVTEVPFGDLTLILRLLIAMILALFAVYSPLTSDQARWHPLLAIGLYIALSMGISSYERSGNPLQEVFVFLGYLLDVGVITFTIYYLQGWNTDLYMAYFIVILMSVKGTNLRHNVWISLMVCFVYGWFLVDSDATLKIFDPNILLRFPFLFIIGVYTTMVSYKLGESEESLQEQKLRLEMLFKQMHDGAVLTDPSGLVLLANNAAAAWLSHPLAVGSAIQDAFQGLNLVPSLKTLLQKKSDHVRAEASRINPKPLYLEVAITKMNPLQARQFQTTPGWIWTIRDITAQKKEEFLTRDFLSVISHKLKTPLVTILGYPDMLQHELKGLDLPKIVSVGIKSIRHQGRKLDHLVDKLLSFVALSKKHSEEIAQERLDLSPVIGKAVEVLAPTSKNKRPLSR